MSLKEKLTLAASLGLAAGVTLAATPSGALAEGQSGTSGEDKCFGVNSCKGTSKCNVSKADVDAAKVAYGKKFAGSAPHGCAGANGCSAAQGHLTWVSVPKGTCISQKKGFLIESKGGKTVVVNK